MLAQIFEKLSELINQLINQSGIEDLVMWFKIIEESNLVWMNVDQ